MLMSLPQVLHESTVSSKVYAVIFHSTDLMSYRFHDPINSRVKALVLAWRGEKNVTDPHKMWIIAGIRSLIEQISRVQRQFYPLSDPWSNRRRPWQGINVKTLLRANQV
jgi:hypothetical protein